MRYAISLITVLLALQSTQAQSDLVRASLLADVEAIQPDRPFQIGVMLEIRPGWHTYWRNPGEGGVPTELELTLPPGFAAGPVQYPLPLLFIQPGEIIGYGYKRQVMLLVEVTPPSDLAEGTDIPIEVEAYWLACDPSICIPGSKKLNISLPVTRQHRPANTALFDDWKRQAPRSWTGEPVVAEVQESAAGPGALITATIPLGQELNQPQVFIDAPPTLLVSDASLTPDGQLRMRLRPAPEMPVLLSVVVGYIDGDNRQTGFELLLHVPRAE